ncbi:hypothetical protein HK101_010644 [Irineochytrium annulatum]|nr:hypothetical protein HK101_010644 [Irineochytrium annulatum]
MSVAVSAAAPPVIQLGAVLPSTTNVTNVSARRVLQMTIDDLNSGNPDYAVTDPATGLNVQFNLTWMDSQEGKGSKMEETWAIDLTKISTHKQNLPGPTVANAISLAMNSPNVMGIIGEYGSGNSGPMILALNSFKVYSCSVSSAPVFSDKSQYMYSFRTVPSDQYQGYRLADLIKYNGWSNVGMLTVNSDYGLGLSQFFVERTADLNITIVAQEAYNSVDNLTPADFESQLTALKAANAFVTVILGYDIDVIQMLRQAKKMGMVGPKYVWIGSDAVYTMYPILFSPQAGAYTDEDRQNAAGMIYTTPLEFNSSPQFDDVTNRYKSLFGDSPLSDSYFYRDCMLTMSKGVKKMLASGFTIAQIQARTTGMNVSTFISTPFNGSSGPVSYDQNGDRLTGFQVANVVGRDLRNALVADVNGVFTPQSKIQFFDGTFDIPLDHVALSRQVIETTSPAGLLFYAVYALAALALLLCLVILILYRATPPVKAMSLPFLLLSGVGLLIEFASVVGWVGRAEDGKAACMSQQWFGWIGFSLVMQGILPKCYRIYRIFENHRMISSATSLRDPYLLAMSVPITLINLAILAAWSAMDPLTAVEVDDINQGQYRFECQSSSPTLQRNFTVVLLVYNGALLMLTILASYVTRNVASAYRETKYLLYGTQNVLICAAVVIALIYSAGSSYMATLYLRLALTFVGTTFMMCMTVGRVAVAAMYTRKERFGSRGWVSSPDGRKSGNGEDGSRVSDRFLVNGSGFTEITIPVKDSSKTLAKWELRKVSFNGITKLFTILHPETLVGDAFIITNDTQFSDKSGLSDCVEVRNRAGIVRLLQFSSAQSVAHFYNLVSIKAGSGGTYGTAPTAAGINNGGPISPAVNRNDINLVPLHLKPIVDDFDSMHREF